MKRPNNILDYIGANIFYKAEMKAILCVLFLASSGASSAASQHDVIEPSSFTASQSEESSAFEPDILIKPKIVSAHSSTTTTTFSSLTNNRILTASSTNGLPEPVSEVMSTPATKQSRRTPMPTTTNAQQQVISTVKATDFEDSPREKPFRIEFDDEVESTISSTAASDQSFATSVELTTALMFSVGKVNTTDKSSDKDIAMETGTTIASTQNTYNFAATATASTISIEIVLSQDYVLFNTIAQLLAYLREHSDRILVVVLGSLCIGLLLAVIFLLCGCDKKDFCSETMRRTKKHNSDHSEEGASLMRAPHPTQNESTYSRPENVFADQSCHASDGHLNNHTDYIDHSQDCCRKERTKTHILLKKWCSCCCANAPWQRNHLDSENSYKFTPNSTSFSDDDIISAVVNSRSQFEGPLPVFPRLLQSEEGIDQTRFSQSMMTGHETANIDDDDTSEYEFSDNRNVVSSAGTTAVHTPPERSISSHNTYRHTPEPTQINEQLSQTNGEMHSALPVTHNAHLASIRKHQSSSSSPKRKLDLPPFPKPTNYGHKSISDQNIPHHTAKKGFNQPQQPNRNPISQNMTQQRHLTAYSSNIGDHYVSLQPQQHHSNTARTLNLGRTNGRLERRDSFYDNSLPRDSPIYEYYQRRQTGRRDLPGTKNINQYYV